MGMRSLDPSNLFFKDWIQLIHMRGWICLQINSQAAFLDSRQDWEIIPEFLERYCKFPKLKQNTMSSENTKPIIHRFDQKLSLPFWWNYHFYKFYFISPNWNKNLEMPKAFELDLVIMVTLYLRKIYQLFKISQYCQWMTTCFKYHLCLKFAHVGNIVFQFRNVSHNHIGGYFNISNQFQGNFLTTLDLSFNNISGDISTVISFLNILIAPQIL
jgi:hypothetical protein